MMIDFSEACQSSVIAYMPNVGTYLNCRIVQRKMLLVMMLDTKSHNHCLINVWNQRKRNNKISVYLGNNFFNDNLISSKKFIEITRLPGIIVLTRFMLRPYHCLSELRHQRSRRRYPPYGIRPEWGGNRRNGFVSSETAECVTHSSDLRQRT